jgi:hypothetical protein
MAQVIVGGTREFDMAVSGEQHPETAQYLRNQVASLGQFTGSASQAWLDSVQQSYQQFASDDAMRHARAALRQVSGYMQADGIRRLNTMEEFQQAPVKMQRYLISHPEVRRLYLAQRIDGWSDTYADVQPGAIGEDHYDYRRVNQGMLKETPDDDESEWVSSTWIEELRPEDRELKMVEQNEIITSQEILASFMLTALQDGTSKTGGLL